MEDSRNIIKAIDALTLKAGGEAVDSKNITEAIDHLKEVYDQEAIGIDDTLTQEGLAADAKAVGDEIASLNSNLETMTLSITNVDSDNDFYAIYDAKSNGESFRQRVSIRYNGLPGGVSVLEGYRNSANYGWLRLSTYSPPYALVFSNVKTDGTWSGWARIPTRTEIDELDARVAALENS